MNNNNHNAQHSIGHIHERRIDNFMMIKSDNNNNNNTNNELDIIELLYEENSMYDTGDDGPIEREIQDGLSLLIELTTGKGYLPAECRYEINDNDNDDGPCREYNDCAEEPCVLTKNINRNTTNTTSMTGESHRSSCGYLKQQQQQQKSRRIWGLPPFPPHKLALLLLIAQTARKRVKILREREALLRDIQQFRTELIELIESNPESQVLTQLEDLLVMRPDRSDELEELINAQQVRAVINVAQISRAIRAGMQRGVGPDREHC